MAANSIHFSFFLILPHPPYMNDDNGSGYRRHYFARIRNERKREQLK